MKKDYVKPTLEAVEVEFESLMTTTSGEQGSTGVGSGSAGDETDDYTNGRRGSWGNLWN